MQNLANSTAKSQNSGVVLANTKIAFGAECKEEKEIHLYDIV
jgi:hypothetical protein